LFCLREIVKEDPDSIDPMFYHYGLELYGNIPLMEPLELMEKPSLHTLAIAVDVSGSCTSENIMKKFWSETYDCISQIKQYHVNGSVLLLQCDDVIQEEKKIELMDFEEVPTTMNIKGSGGTSFIPVFERLKELETKEEKIDALIYLTDGYGDYPKEKPNYPVYFVLSKKSNWHTKTMPDWIEKIDLQ